MVTFRVVKEKHGWSVKTGQPMTTPFWSRDAAVRAANRLAAAIRSHGEHTEVIIEAAPALIDPSSVVKVSWNPAPSQHAQ
jgi:hypothetical protein